ncbi:MAG: hypothetical protein AAF629_22895 [Chloroflexota bacterium]
MTVYALNAKQHLHMKSDVAFQRAKSRGVWEMIAGFLTRRNPYLISLDSLIDEETATQGTYAGLVDISLDDICGSVSRVHDFTRHFAPRFHHPSFQEGWRNVYTMTVSGLGLPPVELYQVGDCYFVQDGHTRISVARHLGWKTVQAQITRLPNSR